MEKQPTKLDYGLKKRSKSRRTPSILADTCHQYLNSFPGIPQTASTIRTFRAATSFLESGSAGTMTMAQLPTCLDYRLDAMKMAIMLNDVALPDDCEFPIIKFKNNNDNYEIIINFVYFVLFIMLIIIAMGRQEVGLEIV